MLKNLVAVIPILVTRVRNFWTFQKRRNFRNYAAPHFHFCINFHLSTPLNHKFTCKTDLEFIVINSPVVAIF